VPPFHPQWRVAGEDPRFNPTRPIGVRCHPFAAGWPMSRRLAPGSPVGPSVASVAPGRHGTHRERERGIGTALSAATSKLLESDRRPTGGRLRVRQAIQQDLQEDRPDLTWSEIRFGWSVAQCPKSPAGMTLAQSLLRAVAGSQVIGGPTGPSFARQRELDGPIDVAFSMADDAGDTPESLESLQSPFADPINQLAVSVIERDVIFHGETRIL
jgi:hypothetical protein